MHPLAAAGQLRQEWADHLARAGPGGGFTVVSFYDRRLIGGLAGAMGTGQGSFGGNGPATRWVGLVLWSADAAAKADGGTRFLLRLQSFRCLLLFSCSSPALPCPPLVLFVLREIDPCLCPVSFGMRQRRLERDELPGTPNRLPSAAGRAAGRGRGEQCDEQRSGWRGRPGGSDCWQRQAILTTQRSPLRPGGVSTHLYISLTTAGGCVLRQTLPVQQVPQGAVKVLRLAEGVDLLPHTGPQVGLPESVLGFDARSLERWSTEQDRSGTARSKSDGKTAER